ncbi:putative entry exclusion protein TrbK-alt [Bradyrhizobium sp. 62B]|uniref:putative entry exclusion protein TrbK-alt n=1 Tax=Bradyrhizobium sp. 62B TaxID=2898442 RepID=UPI0025581C4A|nr:putative entry exclusion protein TrbK-alt [Bradyrhizobium sp. 62B]
MSDVGALKASSLLGIIGVFAVAACTIQLRGREDSSPPKADQTSGATSSDLSRCRSITSEDTAGYQQCKRVWDEHRRRFFGKKDGAAAPSPDESAASLPPASKDQSRIPPGYSPLATPEGGKP